MVIDEEVRTALDTLRRHAAGNDFELHRIDVLERDLTAPPIVEQIDERHQRFNSVIYTRSKNGHYYRNGGIHVDIWRYYHGNIPAGGEKYEVHHNDWNPENNAPSNLVLLTSVEHHKVHNPDEKKFNILKNFICANCGKEYTAPNKGFNRFCSKKCLGKWQRDHGRFTKICLVCGEQFQTEFKQQKYCSRVCASNARKKHKIAVCPVCGKTFEHLPSQPKKYCSRKCYRKSTRSDFVKPRQP